MASVGDKAPDFTLAYSKTDKITLSELRGKPVVINFFPAAFTGNCQAQLCRMRDELADYNDLGATMLAISADNIFSSVAFAKQNGIEYPVLADYTGETIAAYGMTIENFVGLQGYNVANRGAFVIDGEGTIAAIIMGAPGELPDFDGIKAAVAALG